MAFSGLVYQNNATGDVTCATAATGRAITTIKALKHSGHAEMAPHSACSSPTPVPGAPYALDAEGQHPSSSLGAVFSRQQERRRAGQRWPPFIESCPRSTQQRLQCRRLRRPFLHERPPAAHGPRCCSQTSSPLVNAPDWQVYRVDTPVPI